MPKHRTLDFRKFVATVPPDLLARYVQNLSADSQPSEWAMLNGDALLLWLDEAENAEIKGLVEGEFRRINDVAAYGGDALTEVYRLYELAVPTEGTNEEMALRLFLDHPAAWDLVWSRYLLSSLVGKASHFRLPARPVSVTEPVVEEFQAKVREAQAPRGLGSQAIVHSYNDAGQVLLYIERGERIRATGKWDGGDVTFMAYRPVAEDVLTYTVSSGEVKVKASRDSEVALYLLQFAGSFLGDESLGLAALQAPTFDLSSFQRDTFDYKGSPNFAGIALTGVRLKPRTKPTSSVVMRGRDVRLSLRALGIPLAAVDLLAVRLRFRLPKKSAVPSVTFEIAPPAKTDLPDGRYAALINAYLEANGVRLR